jgi:large subunit ribosomal protein L17
MRHKKNRSKLSRPTDQRLALVRNQVAQLLQHGYVNTTLPRAKAAQSVAEKLITRARRGTLADIRLCARQLPGKAALGSLISKVGPGAGGAAGGYTKIAKLKYRRGDGALLVRLSLSNQEAVSPSSK